MVLAFSKSFCGFSQKKKQKTVPMETADLWTEKKIYKYILNRSTQWATILIVAHQHIRLIIFLKMLMFFTDYDEV